MDVEDEYNELDKLAANTTALLFAVVTDLVAGGITRNTASLAAWADGGAATARPVRMHQVPMAALSAELGIAVSKAPGSTPGS
jgi:hypothetical protein